MNEDELIRCSSCRGRKQVEKLGGVVGECNTCKGVGKIRLCDKPLPALSNHDAIYGSAQIDIVDAVSRVMPNQVDPFESAQSKLQDEVVSIVHAVQDVIEIDEPKDLGQVGKKRAVFKRNKG